MSRERKTPRRRFKEFQNAGAWEQRTFDDIADYKKGPFGSALKKDIFVPKGETTVKIYEQQNAINKDWSLERYFITKEYANKLSAFKVKGGDIIVSCAGTIGEIYELPIDAEPGIINQALMRIRVDENIVNKKMFTILFSNMIDNFTQVHSNGSAIKNIPPFSDLKPMKVLVPLYKEQKKIGEYLSNIDCVITLNQRKLEKLKALKKAYLTQMFPSEGESKPKLRFAGFKDEWEKRKLSEFTSYNSSSLTVNNAKEIGLYKLYDANGIIGYTNIEAQTDDYITIIKDGAGVGRVRVLPKNTAFIGTMGAIIPLKCDIYFLYNILSNTNFNKHISGGTIPHIYFSEYGNKKYYIPNIKEQQNIGVFFEKLDKLITLHQRKLEKLQNLKKAYLNEMFV